MTGNRYTADAAALEFVTVKKVFGRSVIYVGPGINPDGIRKERSPGGVGDVALAFDHVFWVAIGAFSVEVTVKSVAALVELHVIGDQPGASDPAFGGGILFELFGASFRGGGANSDLVDGGVLVGEAGHPKFGPVVIINRFACVAEVHEVGHPDLFKITDAFNGMGL